MTTIARMAVLDMRTIAPYRTQGLTVFALVVVLMANRPIALVPVLVLLVTSVIAAYPFQAADKADLETLYAVLPVRRRAVLAGHYAWALAGYVGTAAVGTLLALIFARVQSIPYSAHDLTISLTLAWGLYAVNIAVQYPLLILFGYTRIGVWGTTLPLAGIAIAAFRLHWTISSLDLWLPLVWLAGAAAFVGSAAAATALDRRR
jgi:hypothetical protein